jgi:hypothetical protein
VAPIPPNAPEIHVARAASADNGTLPNMQTAISSDCRGKRWYFHSFLEVSNMPELSESRELDTASASILPANFRRPDPLPSLATHYTTLLSPPSLRTAYSLDIQANTMTFNLKKPPALLISSRLILLTFALLLDPRTVHRRATSYSIS